MFRVELFDDNGLRGCLGLISQGERRSPKFGCVRASAGYVFQSRGEAQTELKRLPESFFDRYEFRIVNVTEVTEDDGVHTER